MQEELEQRTVSVSIQAAKLSGRVLRAAIAAVLQKMEQERTMPKVGRNSMKRLTYKDPGANTIEVSGRIRSFERYARKHQVRYHIEKELGTDPPKWTVYFKANQADALTAAFKEYTKKDLTRSTRPSLLIQLHRLSARVCELCGKTNVPLEIHHVNKVKHLKGKQLWELAMIAKKRKTLAVCKDCHHKIHHP